MTCRLTPKNTHGSGRDGSGRQDRSSRGLRSTYLFLGGSYNTSVLTMPFFFAFEDRLRIQLRMRPDLDIHSCRTVPRSTSVHVFCPGVWVPDVRVSLMFVKKIEHINK